MIAVALLFAVAVPTAEAKYIQLDVVADIKTRFSEGCSSVQEVASLAQTRAIDAIFFGDHAQNSLEFGIWPFERILKKKEDSPSVLASGAAAYLSEVGSVDKVFDQTLLVPGVETTPFYYWTGKVLDKNLVAHNWDKRFLVAGLGAAENYEQLPILNSGFSMKYFPQFQTPFFIIAVLFVTSLALIFLKKYPKTAVFFTLLTLLLGINNHPFRSSPFDQYHGDQGPKPYQELINYVQSRGGLIFWTHVDSKTRRSKSETVTLDTRPHPEDLLLTYDYTGFQAVGEEPIPSSFPGKEWDQALQQYIDGQRALPVWGIGGNDYHCEGQHGEQLGTVRTIVLVRKKDKASVFSAMRKGRMYAVRGKATGGRLSLDDFSITNKLDGKIAVSGEELVVGGAPELKIRIRSTSGGEEAVRVSIIRNGREVKKETASLPYELDWKDTGVNRNGKVYYRVMAKMDSANLLVSNPIFVKFPVESKVASLPSFENLKPGVNKSPVTQKEPTPPPLSSIKKKDTQTKYVRSKADGVALKKGPGEIFPDVTKIKKGERLEYVRKSTVIFNKKPWVMVKKDGRNAFVWEGDIEYE